MIAAPFHALLLPVLRLLLRLGPGVRPSYASAPGPWPGPGLCPATEPRSLWGCTSLPSLPALVSHDGYSVGFGGLANWC